MAHIPACCRTLRFSSFRISAGDRSSRYPRGWCRSSTRWTPRRTSFGLGSISRPQHDVDLWTGHTSLERSLMGASLLVGWADFGDWVQLKWVATNAAELRFLPRFAHFIHRYFVSTLRIALTSIRQLFSLVGVDG